MLLDTSAWIEYFIESEKGLKVKEIFMEKSIYTCPLTIAEISHWSYKNNEEPGKYLTKIKNLSIIIDLDEDILQFSGKIYTEERRKKNDSKISMIDCIIYSTARAHDLTVLTKDGDFKELPFVQML